jgi:hypothetical protein
MVQVYWEVQIIHGRGAPSLTLRGSFNTTIAMDFDVDADEWFVIYSENVVTSSPLVVDVRTISPEWNACVVATAPPSAAPSTSTSVFVNMDAFTELLGLSCDYFATAVGRQAFISAVISTQDNVVSEDITITDCEDVVDLRGTRGDGGRSLATMVARVFWVIAMRVDTLGYVSEEAFMSVFAARFYAAVGSGAFVQVFIAQDPTVDELYTGEDNTVFGPPPAWSARKTKSDSLLSNSELGIMIGLSALCACCLLLLCLLLFGLCACCKRPDNKVTDEALVAVSSAPVPVQAAYGGPEARIFARGRSAAYSSDNQ